MKTRWTRGVLTVGLFLAAFVLTACEIGNENDVVDLHDQQRQMMPPPKATDLPPGLSEDLPRSAQPTTDTKPAMANEK